ncbi:hypothetical protein [Hymenobacter latericus]|uniref:hypothetical protein n=1 Tax=Hymenobacter sp. YIM 151858-1 TaxID=2987688 RepID=UPI002226514A|nr:hypothetical protein [Hymenobacter sp. YIM 151858-1]UYZ58480.1 hypothetical protein OIS50_15625 [Hymenobacter sp. YIM 151858-1]
MLEKNTEKCKAVRAKVEVRFLNVKAALPAGELIKIIFGGLPKCLSDNTLNVLPKRVLVNHLMM